MENTIINDFRNGIFALRTRRFGTVAEIMIKKLYKFDEAGTLAYDKKDTASNQRVEIKFSTVIKSNKETITEDNVIAQCLGAITANRALSSDEALTQGFDCNIQQVKCKEFDVLYYGLFFWDRVEIYKMTSEQVTAWEGYSNKQHRGNLGEGQFHINQDNITEHRKKNLVKSLSYEELYTLLAHIEPTPSNAVEQKLELRTN